jgi:ABC-type transport system involved in multi-copper enzyme maturation permease subunit
MHRALFWKEWRQLALIRWGGIALGAVLPVAFTAGAEMAQRGLLPTGKVDAYAPRDLMYELLPASLALGLWPLMGLLCAAQAFAADRASGTETFLLERPVPRPAVWRARLFASLLTLALVMIGTAAIAATAAGMTGAPPEIGWSRWIILAAAGVGIALLAYIGGMVAASVISAPLAAVLLGAVLGATPALLVAQLSTLFPYARIGMVFLGALLPAFLLPAFVAASWLASCRGEPAGRGRIRRAVTVLSGALVGVLVLFVVLAPISTRANSRLGRHSVFPSATGQYAFVGSIANTSFGGGWIVDVATGAKRGFVAPPIQDVAWSPDDKEFAIVTWAGPLGGVRANERIDIRSTRDGNLLRSFALTEDETVASLGWVKDGLAGIVADEPSRKKSRSPRIRVAVFDAATGARRDTGFESDRWNLQLLGGKDGKIFVRELAEESQIVGFRGRGYVLHPFDVAAAKVEPPLTDAAGSVIQFAGWNGGLSPSGRFARVLAAEADKARWRIVDLGHSAEATSWPSPPWARWLPGDRLVWKDDLEHRTRLFIGPPGAKPVALLEWQDAQVGIDVAPDGKSLFISVLPAPGGPAVDNETIPPDPSLFESPAEQGAVPEELVYLVDEDRFVRLKAPFSIQPSDFRYTQWAASGTLARLAPGVVAFEDVKDPGHPRFVIGGPSDLE